ncbi:nuclear pore membrane glycoprotein 210-like isoform X2 [Stegodyphus dumicola]|uniref:nuclear pore membrane glycoprotein 210-like isoform X2 n=1 Tax=Stegodyphus dumicola TaxID=202533 RepID=UPI0015A9EB71|nr:nuclear pore membrane glycoprotein 210-like isoform X2 [Stegodyphus dumicola]
MSIRISTIGCLIYIFLCLCFFLTEKLLAFKQNSPIILLNYNTALPSNATVEILDFNTEDCFEWYSSDPEVIIVSPVFDKDLPGSCSRKAVVTCISDEVERKITQVTASQKNKSKTGTKVFWDVITDSVANIDISWVTDEVILGGHPEKLTVVAKNKDGHTFTSINGLHFEWKITSQLDSHAKKTADGEEVIRLVKFSDSNYESAKDTLEWEQRGMFGHSVLVEAVNLGSSIIQASLLGKSSKVTLTAKISLKVLPNIKILPSTSLYLLRFATVPISLNKMLGGELSEIEKNEFKIHSKDPSVGELVEDFSSVKGLNYGSTSVIYKSINSKYSDVSVDLHVVKAVRLAVRISGGNFKILEEMKSYIVRVELYDENDNRIYPAENLRLSVSFPSRLFYLNSTTANGTYHVIQAIAPGSGTIRAELKGVITEDGIKKENAVVGSEEVTVCQKLQIFPPRLLLPSDSPSIPLHKVQFTVTGGTGKYSWASSNTSAATVIFDEKNSNIAKLQIYKEGDLYITVTDRNNINFFSAVKVSVQPVIDIEVYPTVVETEIGNTLIIPTAILGYEDEEKKIIRKFDECTTIEPIVEIIDKHVVSYEKEPHIPAYGKGCLSLQFRCKMAGHSRINIFYKKRGEKSNNATFKTTTVLACYKSLKPVHPVRVAVAALGTSKEIAFEGGPRRWPLKKDGHYTKLETSNSELVTIELIKDPIRYNKDLTVFRIHCKALGENVLNFYIGNEPSATNQHPAKSEASVKFICSEPHSLHLKLYKKKSKKQLQQENIVKVPFYGSKTFEIDIWVKDEKGRKFCNISSLSVEWEVSDKTLAEPDIYSDFMTYENAVSGYRKVSREFKEFKMSGGTGDLVVSAKIVKYRKDVLIKEEISDFKEFPEISSSLDLKLVSLRDINAGLYSLDEEGKKVESACDGDTCQA